MPPQPCDAWRVESRVIVRATQSRRRRRRAFPAAAALIACLASLVLLGTGPAQAATGGAGQAETLPGTPETAAPTPTPGNTPFDRQGMWIWYVSRSEGGSIGAIVSRAKRFNVGTVYVKSGDGDDYWSQFSPGLVNALHRAGISVCAWQFVYGRRPVAEARIAAAAIERGADCFVIDAEADYEGRYAAADRYVRLLRAAAGEDYPISLASFPYVDYHPSFPYSVFFGPGGATYNQPQMYWKTIGTSVREVYEHTYLHNRIFKAPIYPLGQTYEAVGHVSLRLFRRFAASYGGLAPSWWSWQETRGKEWGALRARSALRPLAGYRHSLEHPLLKRGSKGDMVVWAQQHLKAAGALLPVTGFFGPRTRAAVRAFERSRGLPVDGQLDTDTWEELLRLEPEPVRWAARPARGANASAVRAGESGASASRRAPSPAKPATRPLSASLPARAYEIPPGPRR